MTMNTTVVHSVPQNTPTTHHIVNSPDDIGDPPAPDNRALCEEQDVDYHFIVAERPKG